jgi:hypothetical protein
MTKYQAALNQVSLVAILNLQIQCKTSYPTLIYPPVAEHDSTKNAESSITKHYRWKILSNKMLKAHKMVNITLYNFITP